MEKKTEAVIDGTLLGPDAIAETITTNLHRLGAVEAESVTFVADGAPWIWDRIAKIIELAGLAKVPTTEVLDCCHVVHQISMALAALGLSKEERNPLSRQHRTLLRNGQWRQVVDELSAFQDEGNPNSELETEIAYLRRHGEAGRLSYASFRTKGLPCGSGAIERSIRLLINLRLKSNVMFWKADNSESMRQVRCQVILDRWDEAMRELAGFRRRIASDDYRWTPQSMSCKVKDFHSTAV